MPDEKNDELVRNLVREAKADESYLDPEGLVARLANALEAAEREIAGQREVMGGQIEDLIKGNSRLVDRYREQARVDMDAMRRAIKKLDEGYTYKAQLCLKERLAARCACAFHSENEGDGND